MQNISKEKEELQKKIQAALYKPAQMENPEAFWGSGTPNLRRVWRCYAVTEKDIVCLKFVDDKTVKRGSKWRKQTDLTQVKCPHCKHTGHIKSENVNRIKPEKAEESKKSEKPKKRDKTQEYINSLQEDCNTPKDVVQQLCSIRSTLTDRKMERTDAERVVLVLHEIFLRVAKKYKAKNKELYNETRCLFNKLRQNTPRQAPYSATKDEEFPECKISAEKSGIKLFHECGEIYILQCKWRKVVNGEIGHVDPHEIVACMMASKNIL